MTTLESARIVLVVVHLIGVLSVLGLFLLQLRRPRPRRLVAMLVGAAVAAASGAGLVAVRGAAGLPVNDAKIAVKLTITVLVLAAVVVAIVQQRRTGRSPGPHGDALPLVHTAAGLTLVNLGLAVFWT